MTDLWLMPAPIPLSSHLPFALDVPAHVIHLRKAQMHYVEASINGQTTALLVDSGCTRACLSWATAKRMGLMELVREYRREGINCVDGYIEMKVQLLRPVTVVLDGAVEAVVEFTVMPEDSDTRDVLDLLPITILTEFGCYYQFHPNGDASLCFRRKQTPGLIHGVPGCHKQYFL